MSKDETAPIRPLVRLGFMYDAYAASILRSLLIVIGLEEIKPDPILLLKNDPSDTPPPPAKVC